jgi:rRNA-processing protein FCF1
MKVILDTNAVMAVGEFGLDVFGEVKGTLFIVEGTLQELEKIQQAQRGKFKAAAKLGVSLLKRKDIESLPDLKNDVDSSLVAYSQKGYVVLTQDATLKKRLQKPYLTIRQKKKVVMVR